MKIGYARVSTDEQCLDLQLEALRAAGCARVFEDVGITGAATERPGLADAMAALQDGDVLVVWKLDRLGRSLAHLVGLLEELGEAGIGFASLTECIDTTTPGGRLVFHIMAALAEFERSLIAERTRAGMRAAKDRGVRIGRPPKLTNEQLDGARALLDQGDVSKRAIAALLGVDESTLRRRLKTGCSSA